MRLLYLRWKLVSSKGSGKLFRIIHLFIFIWILPQAVKSVTVMEGKSVLALQNIVDDVRH